MAEPETIGLNDNDDVLMEVLASLPPKSVLRFKAVSRQWRDLLSSPAFLRRYAAAHRGGDRLVAFFQRAGVHETSETMAAKHCNILPICNELEKDYINVPRHVGHFVSSSNGLILCSRSRGTLVTYHVGNPLTGKFLELPPPPHGKSCLILDNQQLDKYGRITSECSLQQPPLLSAGLICKTSSNDLTPVYTVIRAGMNYTFGRRRILHVDSYSSKSGKWTPGIRKLVATGIFKLSRAPPVVANGVVHWYTRSGDIAVYDPKGGNRHLQLIKVPYSRKDKNVCYAVTRSTDDDVLWLAVLRRNNLLLYMLPKELGNYKRQVDIKSNEWVLMHDVSILSISKLMNKGLIACECCTLECLIPESESGSGVVAVLLQEEKVFLYNAHRKSIRKLDYSGSYNDRYNRDFYRYRGPYNQFYRLFPYLRSSCLSSYCL